MTDKWTISTKCCYFPLLILQNRSQLRSVSLSDRNFAQFSQPLQVKYLTRFSQYCAHMHFIQFFLPFSKSNSFKMTAVSNSKPSGIIYKYNFMYLCVHICFILTVQDSFKMTAVSNLKPSGITYTTSCLTVFTSVSYWLYKIHSKWQQSPIRNLQALHINTTSCYHCVHMCFVLIVQDSLKLR